MPLSLRHGHRADIIKAYNPRLSESANKSYYDSIKNDSRIRVLSRERVLISRMLIIGPVHAQGRTRRVTRQTRANACTRVARGDVRARECADVRSIDTAGGTTTETSSLCI